MRGGGLGVREVCFGETWGGSGCWRGGRWVGGCLRVDQGVCCVEVAVALIHEFDHGREFGTG